MTSEERITKHIETLQIMRGAMLHEENWENFKPFIEACIYGGMALQMTLEQDEFIPKSVIEDIIAEIMQYMFLNGFGSEYQDDVRKIIEKHISEKENCN